MVRSCSHDEEVGKHSASLEGVDGMSVLLLDSAILVHSVESPSMVDPQWNILY